VSFSFNPVRGLIRVRVELSGPIGNTAVYLALDTGATATLIGLDPLRLAGYDATSAGQQMQITTGSGVAQAHRMPVTSLTALGQTRANFPVVAHNLPPRASVDGVLGLDFFRDQVLTIDFVKGEIILTAGGPTP
jgi:predicted aspartyl protease